MLKLGDEPESNQGQNLLIRSFWGSLSVLVFFWPDPGEMVLLEGSLYALVAQLDRVVVFETKGCQFESDREYQFVKVSFLYSLKAKPSAVNRKIQIRFLAEEPIHTGIV